MNFELILTWVVLFSGAIVLIDRFWLAARRSGEQPWIVEYAHAFFPILFVVLLLRAFVIEPFRIPSGSLKPSLLVGDFVFVNKFAYGVRLPLTHTLLFRVHDPKRGDIAVFRWPLDTHIDYIKRIIGVPGDEISYIDKILYINGKRIPQQFKSNERDFETSTDELGWSVALKQEDLEGVVHDIYLRNEIVSENVYHKVVPAGKYFAMGDNRDDSKDSREWGFVSETDLAGKAFMIWFSWDSRKHRVRWERIGMWIQ